MIEVLVVLILLGLASTMVAPAFREPTPEPRSDLQEVLEAARGLAVRNAATITLSFTSDGRWTAEQADGLAPADLRGGTLPKSSAALRVQVSPLGACSLEAAQPVGPFVTFDPVRCRLAADRAR
jgi:type II secretory pathway pseudopilin PulG